MTATQKAIQEAVCHLFPDEQSSSRALSESQFVPFFQPLVTLRTGQLHGFEVLARWQHPTEGLVSPDRFIPVAERDGWIGELTLQILKKALAAAAILPDNCTIAFNIAPPQLRDLRLPEQIRALAIEANFPLSRIVIEITESALIDDLEEARTFVAQLKTMGCRLALDDFGTGYSSLHHLQSLPFDKLKVDRSFVSSMTEKRDSRKIVAAVVGLGQSLGLTTVAEGIETQEQAEILLWLGCELGQGYLYGRPVPAEGLAASVSALREKIVSKDLSAWKRISASNLDASPSQRLAQLQAVYDGAPVGLAFLDQNLRYVNLNKKLAEMNGTPVENHLGTHVSEMIPDLFPYVESYIKRALTGEVITDVEATIPSSGRTCMLSYQPGVDEAGEVIGVAIAVTDITERKRLDNELKTSEEHYRNMVELNPQVLWVMDSSGRNLDVSPRWDKATGLMKHGATDTEWLKSVHPDDLPATLRAIAASQRSESPIDVEYRALDGSGHYVWKRSMGSPRFDADGKIVCWYGSVQDIARPRTPAEATTASPVDVADIETSVHLLNRDSDAKEDERRHQALLQLEILDTPAEAEFDDLVALASEICAVPISAITLIDSDRYWFKASVGLTTREIPFSYSFCKCTVDQRALLQVEDASQDERFKSHPLVLGDPNIRFYAGVPLYASEGIAIGTLCVIDNVPRSLSPSQTKALTILSHQVQARLEHRAERIKLLQAQVLSDEATAQLKQHNSTLTLAKTQLKGLPTTDFLTGLLNRRAFEQRLHSEFTTALHKHRPLSVLVMDIDRFKNGNDKFGHVAGNDALCKIGHILHSLIRSGDAAARIGGEEFAIVLPETTLDQAVVVAQRLQELLRLTADNKFPPITLSIGIAGMQASAKDWQTLLLRADLAMHQAQLLGRDRFCLHEAQSVA